MSRIELLGNIDDQHRLTLLVPHQVKAGPVKVILEVADEQEDDWFPGVAAIWAGEYDPREDIYSLKDGEPFDETA